MTQDITLIRPIKLVIFDVDGVLTDGRIVIDDNGVESKFFHATDGVGLKWLKRSGLELAFLTGRKSRVVEIRAKELGVDRLHQGALVKIDVYEEILESTGLTDSQIAYAGDDFVDLPVIRRVGFSMAPADAREEIKKEVHYVSTHKGGQGAARDMAELIMKAQGTWDGIMSRYYGNSPNS